MIEAANVDGPRLNTAQFQRIRERVHQICGIHLQDNKLKLVQMRLAKRVRDLGLKDFKAYLRLVDSEPGGQELRRMIDILTTNKTSFFREPEHFAYLSQQLTAWLEEVPSVCIWSAGCASGEEPLTIAMVALEGCSQAAATRVRILATDISSESLLRAHNARYDSRITTEIPPHLLRKYFLHDDGHWRANPTLQSMIFFARLNLMDRWPMHGPFDAIFCRNVMIYFDSRSRASLINRFWQFLRPGGCLFVGNSESLTGISHPFRFVRPGIYQRDIA